MWKEHIRSKKSNNHRGLAELGGGRGRDDWVKRRVVGFEKLGYVGGGGDGYFSWRLDGLDLGDWGQGVMGSG